ncbi:MAG: hypothetical protein GY778_25675 [bacterium]|nr:hypothetical protein [bacterium]
MRSTICGCVVVMLAACVGCEAPVRIQPGLSAIRLSIQAEPKTGYRRPVSSTTGDDVYEDEAPGASVPTSGAYALVDYDRLENIVVWMEPQGAGAPDASEVQPATVSIDLSKPDAADRPWLTRVTGVGGRLVFDNRSSRPQIVYSLSEGNEFDLGEIAPGANFEHVVQQPGLIEVLSEARDDPIARIYVAPTPWVQRARSGRRVTFTDLPPGPYRAYCWHPRLPGSTTTVTLVADEVTQARLTVAVNSLPTVP